MKGVPTERPFYYKCADLTGMPFDPTVLKEMTATGRADMSVAPLQGVDFFFSNRAHALKFIDFVQGVVPVKYRHDKQLVSHNEHNNIYNYKYTFSVEIVPVCRVAHPPITAVSAALSYAEAITVLKKIVLMLIVALLF
jgi:hypothetical protein